MEIPRSAVPLNVNFASVRVPAWSNLFNANGAGEPPDVVSNGALSSGMDADGGDMVPAIANGAADTSNPATAYLDNLFIDMVLPLIFIVAIAIKVVFIMNKHITCHNFILM